MSNRHPVTLLLCVLFLGVSGCTDNRPTLVWNDEFDRDGLPDPARWSYEEGFVRNREAQLYTREREENARIENGMLIIEARREKLVNPDYEPGSDNWRTERDSAGYTSAAVTTRSKAAWKYGRIEVRAKLPTGNGMWPAIWMLGENIDEVGWPECGEIDIMENVGFEPDEIHANVHTKAYNHVKGTGKGASMTVAAPYDSFHTYAVDWTEDRMAFSVDDSVYFVYENEGTGTDVWPFDQAHFLILNIAVGGTWGGQQGIDDSIFPQKLLVDYVRVYQ